MQNLSSADSQLDFRMAAKPCCTEGECFGDVLSTSTMKVMLGPMPANEWCACAEGKMLNIVSSKSPTLDKKPFDAVRHQLVAHACIP